MNLARATARLAKGEVLHMQIGEEGSVWWFEAPHQVVPARVIAALIERGALVDSGDSLFPAESDGQSFRGAAHKETTNA